MSKMNTTKVEHIGNDQVVVTFHCDEWNEDRTALYEQRYEVLFIYLTPVVVRRRGVGRDTEVFRLCYTSGNFLDKVSKRIKKYLKKDYSAAKLAIDGELNDMALLFNKRVKTVNEFSDGSLDYDASELEWCWEKGEWVVRELDLHVIDDEEGDEGVRSYADTGISNIGPARYKDPLHNEEEPKSSSLSRFQMVHPDSIRI